MRLHILAVGRIGRCPEAELVQRYLGRLTWPHHVTELSEGKPLPAEKPAGTRRIVLDERGRSLDSAAFAAVLGRWRDEGVRETQFLIGAADGVGPAAKASADMLLNLGALTWPHMLARAMLAEQLYRATMILAGHPYHREGANARDA
jgi:23S rRNA (pseudouridine1915-N3)-methyltransferase